MTFVDATYINTGGGKEILKLFLSKFKPDIILIDKRNNIDLIGIKTHYVKGELDRFYYLKAYKNKIKTYVSLNNLPPNLNLKCKVIIYFHNTLYFSSSNFKYSLARQLQFYVKSLYIKFLNRNDYQWVVQTNLVKTNLSGFLNISNNKIHELPFFDSKYGDQKFSNTNFIYVSDDSNHKNQDNLIESFILASQKTSKHLTLILTISHRSVSTPKNLTIVFKGYIDKQKILELYENSKFLIYPSLGESFGLPLIEAANHGCKVIASDLPYVHEIIRPSLTFNPYSVESISNSILKAVETDNLPETKVLVENKLDNFIDFIISQDVQR